MSAAGERKVDHPLYQVWQSMRARCGNPARPDYYRYGGRGIRVSPRWNDFWQFVADMGPRPSPEHSIDRIDNSGNYEKGNCRWATHRQQVQNSRCVRFIEFNNKRFTVTDWAHHFGISQSAMSHRIRRHGIDKAMRMGARS